jgi:tungstate transport system ATP-binding protein
LEARDLQLIRGGMLVLNIPSLVIPEGEILSIIGPNGAGKSTLLQTLCSILKPSRGRILFTGRHIGDDMPVLQYRRRLAMVLQEPLLFNTTVYKNVASGLKIRGMKRNDVEPTVMSALERFGIANLKDRSARTLSGGEARKVSLARALATNPEILFLDEPFSSLDPIVREELIEDLERVLHQTRTTTVFVTHDRQEALRLSTRVGVMRNGEILQTGSPREITNHPANEFVASISGVETILRGEVIRKSQGSFVVSVSGKEIEAAGDRNPGERVLLCIRPENVNLSHSDSTKAGRGMNTFPARIEKLIPQWLYKKVRLDCGFPLVAYVPDQDPSAHLLEEGMEVTASIKAIHVIAE